MYMKLNPQATITVTGGGSGVGISALMDGTTDLAMASRRIKFSEKLKMKQSHHEPCEVIVAYDALAIIVHPDNPVKQLNKNVSLTSCKVRSSLSYCIIRVISSMVR